MTEAIIAIDGVLRKQLYPHPSAEVTRIVERHREALFGLADALISAGRQEEEVIAILQSAVESFLTKLKLEIERTPS